MDWGAEFVKGPGLWEVLLLVPIALSFFGIAWAAYLIGRIERRVDKSVPQSTIERSIDSGKESERKP